MTPEEIAAKEAADAAAKAKADAEANPKTPLDAELAKAEEAKKAELKKALYKRGQIDNRIKELGGTPPEGTPAVDPEEQDDNAPVTVGMLRKRDEEKVTQDAVSIADERLKDDPKGLDLVKHYLTTKVKPSGNPEEDFKFALAAVSALKNAKIVEEISRRGTPSLGNGSGAPPKFEEDFVPTPEEMVFMAPPFNTSKEKIIAARKKQQSLNQ